MNTSTIELIRTVLIYALPVLFAITLHEAAHAFVANRLGDNTASSLGRVTLNPIAHIDLVGTIIMPILLYFTTHGSFLFGYAKPVPVRFDRLRSPKMGMVWVALAGPASNFFQALIWGALSWVLMGVGVQETFFLAMCKAGVFVNLVMFAFNLFPLPPLDGGRILVGLLPSSLGQVVSRIEPYGFFVVMGLVMAGIINDFWMSPLVNVCYRILESLFPSLRAIAV